MYYIYYFSLENLNDTYVKKKIKLQMIDFTIISIHGTLFKIYF